MSKNNMPYVIDNNNVRIPPRYHDDYNKYDDRLSYQGSNLMIEKFMNNRNISNVYNGLDYIKPKYTNKNRDRFYGIGIRRRPILSRPDSKYDDIYLDNENMRRLRWHRDKLIFARRK